MLRWLNPFSKEGRNGSDLHVEPAVSRDPGLDQYPSVDPGIPSVPVDDILERNGDMIARIKLAYGADSGSFSNEILPLLRAYAEFVHLLPATADNYFCRPGGLFRLGVEVGFYALQSTDSQIFSGGATIRTRRELEPRWRRATFIAGLCHEVHRTLSHLVVTDEAGHEWPSYTHSLAAWIDTNRVSRYYLKWVPGAGEMRSLGVFAVPHIISRDALQFLAHGNATIVPQMMGCICGLPSQREHSALDHVVRRAVALVIDRELKTSADRYGRPILGSHLERYLLDAMRRLVAENEAWHPNREKSRVWFSREGVYLVWPNAASDIAHLLESDQVPGIPKSPETVLEILVAAGVVVPASETHATVEIYPGSGQRPYAAVRVSSPELLFAFMPNQPEPIDGSLLAPSSSGRPEAEATKSPGKRRAPQEVRQSAQQPLALDAVDDLSGSTAQGAPSDSHHRSNETASDVVKSARQEYVEPETTGPPSSPEISIKAPTALIPPVKAALQSIVATMNQRAKPVLARTSARGVFVPLSSFKALQVETAIAVRALADTGMLVVSPATRSKTVVEEFNRENVTGVVIHPDFVLGLLPPNPEEA